MPSPPRPASSIRCGRRSAPDYIRRAERPIRRIVRFVRFHGMRHPRQLGAQEIRAFLSHLTVRGRVAASTQSQALSALLFLFRHVLDIGLTPVAGVIRPQASGTALHGISRKFAA